MTGFNFADEMKYAMLLANRDRQTVISATDVTLTKCHKFGVPSCKEQLQAAYVGNEVTQ